MNFRRCVNMQERNTKFPSDQSGLTKLTTRINLFLRIKRLRTFSTERSFSHIDLTRRGYKRMAFLMVDNTFLPSTGGINTQIGREQTLLSHKTRQLVSHLERSLNILVDICHIPKHLYNGVRLKRERRKPLNKCHLPMKELLSRQAQSHEVSRRTSAIRYHRASLRREIILSPHSISLKGMCTSIKGRCSGYVKFYFMCGSVIPCWTSSQPLRPSCGK